MKIGFLFPGQGAQSVGMGSELYQKYEDVKKIYDKVQEITKIDIKKISFEGPEELLNQTNNTQVAILTESLAILEVLKKNNIKAEMSAGLSLGEYTALIEDEILSLEDGVKLVQKRGQIMQDLTPKGNWKMAAILGLDEKQVENVCKQVENGFVVPANFNTIGQIVISGEEKAVVEAGEIAKAEGAKKVSMLNTQGPFHTEKLVECSNALKEELIKTKMNKKNSKVVRNIDGKTYEETDDIVEKIGVEKSKKVMQEADITVLVLNNNESLTEEEKTLINIVDKQEGLIFINKIDLQKKIEELNVTTKVIKGSSIKNQGIEELKNNILEKFQIKDLSNKDLTYLSNTRQISLAKKALQSIDNVIQENKANVPVDMLAIDIKMAWEDLGKIIGEYYESELVDNIFERFCLGK